MAVGNVVAEGVERVFFWIAGILFVNHFFACCWFAIGSHTSPGWAEADDPITNKPSSNEEESEREEQQLQQHIIPPQMMQQIQQIWQRLQQTSSDEDGDE